MAYSRRRDSLGVDRHLRSCAASEVASTRLSRRWLVHRGLLGEVVLVLEGHAVEALRSWLLSEMAVVLGWLLSEVAHTLGLGLLLPEVAWLAKMALILTEVALVLSEVSLHFSRIIFNWVDGL